MKPTKIKRAVIKEEFVAVTGDGVKALILNQFLYWSEIKFLSEQLIDEELEHLKTNTSGGTSKNCEEISKVLSRGWIYKKADELASEIMLGIGEKTVLRHIEVLIKQGFLLRRHNPNLKYDRTYQYRINFKFLTTKLNELGYSLDGYVVQKPHETAQLSKSQNDVSNMTNDAICNGQNDVSKSQNDCAIPEITPEASLKELNISNDIFNEKSFKNEEPKEEKSKKPNKRNTFVPPTIEEVRTYCQERNNNIDPEAFIAYYSCRDWYIGGTNRRIKDWKSAVITWEKNEGNHSNYAKKPNKDLESEVSYNLDEYENQDDTALLESYL